MAACVSGIVSASQSGRKEGSMPAVKEGSKAPDFTLPTDGGGEISLASLRGQKVVLYFYPQDDTETCTLEAVSFSNSAKDFAKAATIVVGISPDTVKSHARFRAKHGLGTLLAADEGAATIRKYGLWGEKTTFGRTYMGVERATFLIDSKGIVRRAWRKVRIKGHVEEVLAAARQLKD
jgi:peroxiredoxin Q/BCP